MRRVNDPAVAIEVHKLVREFRKGPRAVDEIDLVVQTGEIYGFLGPNGAGKSTTVLMLTTLLPPTSGHATVGGFDIVRQGAQVRATIGAALQEAALDAILTGREHLTLQATLQGIPAKQRKERTQTLLERVGLAEAADRRVGGYSGGMKRRLTVARAYCPAVRPVGSVWAVYISPSSSPSLCMYASSAAPQALSAGPPFPGPRTVELLQGF